MRTGRRAVSSVSQKRRKLLSASGSSMCVSESTSRSEAARRLSRNAGLRAARVSVAAIHSKWVCTVRRAVSAAGCSAWIRSATASMSIWNSSSSKSGAACCASSSCSSSKEISSERMLARRSVTPPTRCGGMKLTAASTPMSAATAIHAVREYSLSGRRSIVSPLAAP